MRVQVEIVIAPHPPERVQKALRAAGKRLASATDTVSVQVRATEPPTAVLEFEMPTEAQYKVVDKIDSTSSTPGNSTRTSRSVFQRPVADPSWTSGLTGWYRNCNEGNPLIGGEYDINGNGR